MELLTIFLHRVLPKRPKRPPISARNGFAARIKLGKADPVTDSQRAAAARIKLGKADPVTDSQRAAAARIKVATDLDLGNETEPWIKKLAEEG